MFRTVVPRVSILVELWGSVITVGRSRHAAFQVPSCPPITLVAAILYLMSESARSKRAGIGRRPALWLGLAFLLAAACSGVKRDTPPAWPLVCSFFPPGGEALSECARRGPDGEIVVRAGVVPDDGEATAVQAVIVEDDLLFALASGRTAPALWYDNGPDYFVEGLARSPRDGKVGFVNERLELVVPREWDFAFPFADGVARVCTGCAVRREEGDEHSEVVGGSWGYVDREGRLLVPVVHARDELPAPPTSAPARPL